MYEISIEFIRQLRKLLDQFEALLIQKKQYELKSGTEEEIIE